MTLPPARRLARYVEPSVDGKRIDRVWAAVSSRRVARWSMPRFVIPAIAATCAVAAAVVITGRTRGVAPAAAVSEIVLESGTSQSVTLADGSSAVLGHDARLRFNRVDPSRVEATLERGDATFDVRHSDARPWVVHARGFDVMDRGTRFVVSVSDAGVRVHVENGSVEIVRPGASGSGKKLEEGESWTSGTGAVSDAPAGAATPVEAPPPSVDVAPASPSMPAAAAVPQAPGPRELLEAANAARVAGHPREAAQDYDAIRSRFRGDPRAGLAAFELGRLRLDALGDPAGSVSAFDDAIVLAPGAGFREDAEARRVEALDRMHDSRCPAARQAFLARYPNGLHAASVSSRCP